MRKIQKVAEEVPNAWNRSKDPDGHSVSCSDDTSKGIIDASWCGAFKQKSAEEARDLIEDLAKCNMKAPSKFSRGGSRGKGVMELSKMTAMEAKLDAIMHRMDKQERKLHTAHEIEAVERELMRRSANSRRFLWCRGG